MVSTWLLGFVVGVVFLQLLVVMYRYANRDRESENDRSLAPFDGMGTDASTESDGDDDGGTTACSACGAENAAEYRYCRLCVSDLSGSSVPEHRWQSASSRLF